MLLFWYFISVSNAPILRSKSSFSPFNLPINCSFIITFSSSIIFVSKIISYFKPLARTLALLSIKLFVSSSWSLSESLSSIYLILLSSPDSWLIYSRHRPSSNICNPIWYRVTFPSNFLARIIVISYNY